MGSRWSRFRQNRNRRNMEIDSDSEVEQSSSDGAEDESPSLAVFLALMLRSGQVRLVRSDESNLHDDDSNASETEEIANCCPKSSAGCTGNTSLKGDLWHDFSFVRNNALSSGTENQKQKFFQPHNLAMALRQRESNICGFARGNFTPGICTSISSRFIPNHISHRLTYHEKMFCGTYSRDGSLFLSACQDRHIRVFNTQNGLHSQPFKVIRAKDVGWSVLDTAFSPDSRYAAYSSWSSYIHLCTVHDGDDPRIAQHLALDLRPNHHSFAVFSLKFSSDSEEIICGANDGYLYVYNLDQSERTLHIDAHEDDINAVCFADKSSQILFSGGDDGLVKVWDRRTFSENNATPAGIFAGHRDGITFIDSKGDARYLLSNSKDQSIKLWDMRNFSSESAVDSVRRIVSNQSWDYRWQNVPRALRRHKRAVDGDTSVQTYTGHKVMNTLIRARFSPVHTTGNRYIYSGCSSGRVFVYDLLTGKVETKHKMHKHCVRDVHWHPYEHQMMSSSWDGTIAEWEWKAEQ